MIEIYVPIAREGSIHTPISLLGRIILREQDQKEENRLDGSEGYPIRLLRQPPNAWRRLKQSFVYFAGPFDMDLCIVVISTMLILQGQR
ncbi:hypothetical protein ACQKWADRAFT_291734 [Trichoderma austrokoningii]